MLNARRILFSIIFTVTFVVRAIAVNLGFPGEESALVGIYVKDLRSGLVTVDHNAAKALVPASITKSLTAATALSLLGENYHFETNVFLTGHASAETPGLWCGDIVVEGNADPTVDSELFKDLTPMAREIADAVKQRGITAVTGRVIVEESLSGAGCIPEWEIDDVGWGYGAGLYGFNYRDNKFRLWPATGKTEPYVPGITVETKHADSNDIVRGVGSDHYIVYGREPNNPKWTLTTTMNDPASVFSAAVAARLAEAGIDLYDMDSTSEQRTLLCTHQSAPLVDILQQMMYESHNLYAEGMLRAIAPGESRDKAIDREMRYWKDKGVNVQYNKLCDGSGLARADRLQPRMLGNVLEKMSGNNTFVSLFPKVGINGTVSNFLKETSLKGKLALKTGSMNGVQCYAGYKLGSDGRPTHVVVIMVNSFFCPRAELRGTIEKFLVDTFK